MIIHLIAPKDKTKWHNSWHMCYQSWEKCPYEIKMWHDEDVDQLLKEDNEEFYNTLSLLPSIYKWDYVRYVILEKFGGAYFDMDVKIVDPSFFAKLDPNRIYLMEGTTGTYLENSIMISSLKPHISEHWRRLKYCSQYSVNNTPKQDLTPMNVVWVLGPGLLSKFFIDIKIRSKSTVWEILGHNQFASTTNTLVYTRHYQSSVWNNSNK